MINIVDIGLSNVGSVLNMLRRLGCEAQITSDPQSLRDAIKLIVPGVGKFDKAVKRIDNLGLRNALCDQANAGTPILGICLGMQLLMEKSEEGDGVGLGLIEGKVVKFRPSIRTIKVPHMGWNKVAWRGDSPLVRGFDEELDQRFYFVHSYVVKPADPTHILGTTDHGVEFASAVQRGNVYGVQFHPEKSHRFGKQLLQNFIDI